MAGSVIGAQMYSVREHTQTQEDMAKSFARLRQMGYEAVQLSAGADIEAEELAGMLKSEGLHCAATHVSLDVMKDTDRCIAYHQALDCKYTAIGGYFGEQDTDAWLRFVDEFNAVGSALAERGLRVGYHNHSHELAPLNGPPAGSEFTVLAMLLQKLDPSIWFEVDTYWIAHGGGDPADWIKRVVRSGSDRLPCVHFKDMAITPEREQKMCEIGSGNLNWPPILDACRAAGTEWYLVERDNGDMDPFDSLGVSLNNMRAMGLP